MAKKKPISVACRKAKGRRLQKEIAEYISKTINIPAMKDGDIESRPMGQAGRDVILRGEALNIWQALAQAEEHGGKPIVFFKRNRSETYVALKADDFFELYELALEEILNGKDNKDQCDKD
jgi:hypothetical protein